MSHHKHDSYLKRLPIEYYTGQSYVHWSLTIADRREGWLEAKFYYKFREVLTHTMFRYGLTCPIYCCMPDHFHFVWMGLFDECNQLNAMKYFRRQINLVLQKIKYELQPQGHDRVLRDEELERGAFEDLCEYIARNPERKGLVAVDGFREYAFTDCLIPGAPEVHFRDEGYWDTFWRITSSHKKFGLRIKRSR